LRTSLTHPHRTTFTNANNTTKPKTIYNGQNQVIDEGCSYPIQQGAKLSRADVHTFRHNDANDLAALLKRLDAEAKRARAKPSVRRMIVVEGVYGNTGEVAPLR
jgi:7-keto-8-aminopelargonate synthetase-like enzyme